MLVEGRRENNNVVVGMQNCFFNPKGADCINLKTIKSCVSPYNSVYCKDVSNSFDFKSFLTV